MAVEVTKYNSISEIDAFVSDFKYGKYTLGIAFDNYNGFHAIRVNELDNNHSIHIAIDSPSMTVVRDDGIVMLLTDPGSYATKGIALIELENGTVIYYGRIDGGWGKGFEDNTNLAFTTNAPDNYVSFAPIILRDNKKAPAGTTTKNKSVFLVSGISYNKWNEEGLTINGHKYYGVNTVCLRAD